MTSLSPAMLRITCVGCAASGGAGVPAGFTHTDARSAAPTPPLRRERDEKEERQTSGRTRQRRVCSGRANEEKRPLRKHTQ